GERSRVFLGMGLHCRAEGSAKGAGAKQKALRRGLGDPAPAGFAAPAGAGWRRAPDTGRGEELEGRSEEGDGGEENEEERREYHLSLLRWLPWIFRLPPYAR
ncbi:unnamed protein product, partial [Prorocentrum cordatum]